MPTATKAQAEQMDLAQNSGRELSATKGVVPSDQVPLAQEAFKKILHILKQLGLYAQSPKFFIIYAHENKELGLKAHKSLVKNYISWFKEIFFDVDSDRSPHGFRPMHTVAHKGASLDIIKNQICLLPPSWHRENVDYVLVFYSELLARYMEDERECKVTNDQTYMDVIFNACDNCGRSASPPSWDEVQTAVKKAQERYSQKMTDKFHHVLTELALLKFRHSILGPKYTIPILLFEHEEKPAWRPEFLGMEDTEIRVSLNPEDQHQTFFKILTMFETLEPQRTLIEALEQCYKSCVDLLKENTPQLAEYQTQVEVEIHQTLQRLNDSKHLWTAERPINKRTIRDILSIHSQINYASAKRLSGKKLPENLGDIGLLANDGHMVSIHNLFDEFERQTAEGKQRIQPRRILIQGKPGVGKSTLSGRIMYEYSCRNDLQVKFDLVVQVSVRKLGRFADLADLLFNEYFRTMTGGHKLSKKLSEVMLDNNEKSSILIILDGLDESRQWSSEKRSLLEKLMSRPIVVVTSRYYESDITPEINLTLEALGLSMESVKAYIWNDKIVPSDTAKHILDFIEKSPFIMDMVQVPIHLDILCWSWDELHRRVSPFAAFQNVGELDELPIAALYQAVVYALWRKDIPGLGKVDHGEKITGEIVNSVHDLARLERVVSAESRLLEEIGINLMKSYEESGQFEFGDEDITKAIQHLERKDNLPLSLDRNLNKLSLLHSDHHGETRRFSFIHLTFQEFFAARWLIRNEEKLGSYLQRYKYNRRFERVWRFVVGLLQIKNDTDRLFNFFNAIEGGSRDLLGPAHQRLIMNCLGEMIPSKEATIISKLRIELETQLAEWLIFECETTDNGVSYSATETNLPWRVLDNALKWCPNRERLLHSIKTGPQMPSRIGALLIRWLEFDIPINEKGLVLETLAHHHQVLSPNDLENVAALVTSKDRILQKEAALLLQQQPRLPLHTLSTIITKLKRCATPDRSRDDEKEIERLITVLQGRPMLPQAIIESLVGMLKNKMTIKIAVKILSLKSALPEPTLVTLIGMLESQEMKETRDAAAEILIRHNTALSQDHLATLVVLLKNKEAHQTRDAAARILGSKLNLATETLATLVAMLKYEGTRDTAAGILKSKCALSLETLAALVEMIGNQEAKEIAAVAVEILQARSPLPPSTLAYLVGMLRNNGTRNIAARVLQRQSAISPDILASLVEMVRNRKTRKVAVTILDQQLSLPPEIWKTLVAMLRDRDTREGAARGRDTRGAAARDRDKREVVARVLEQQSSLPPEAWTALVAMLGDRDAGEAAARVLQYQVKRAIPPYLNVPSLELGGPLVGPDMTVPGLGILTASVAMLKDKRTEEVAVSFLERHMALPWQTLKAIEPILEDGNAHVKCMAAKALKGKPALPLYILTPLARLLREDTTKSIATEVFHCQLALPQELELELPQDADEQVARTIMNKPRWHLDYINALVESFQHINCDPGECFVESIMAKAFESQPDVPKRILQASVDMLRSKCQLVRNSGEKLLYCQSALPKEIAKDIAKGLGSDDEDLRYYAAQILARTTSLLPIWELHQTVGRVKGSQYLLKLVVEGYIDGELALPKEISDEHMEWLYLGWLRAAFEHDLCWYVDGKVSYIETPGQRRMEVRSNCEEQEFWEKIRRVQKKLKVPKDNLIFSIGVQVMQLLHLPKVSSEG